MRDLIPIRSMSLREIRPFVCALDATVIITMSLCLKSFSISTCGYGVLLGDLFQKETMAPWAWQKSAKRRPIMPSPTIPTFLDFSSAPKWLEFSTQSFFIIKGSFFNNPIAINVQNSATALVDFPGVYVRGIFFDFR